MNKRYIISNIVSRGDGNKALLHIDGISFPVSNVERILKREFPIEVEIRITSNGLKYCLI